MLDLDTKRRLGRTAFIKGCSLSEVVREILRKELASEEEQIKGSGIAFLKKLAFSSVSGPGDADYDRYAF